MTDTDNAPVTQADLDNATIEGLPALVKAMCERGVEPEVTDATT
jgi:hypothetical protein